MDAETQLHYRTLGLSSETVRALMYLDSVEQDDGELTLTEIDLQAGIYSLIVELDCLRVLVSDWSRTLLAWVNGQCQDKDIIDVLADMQEVLMSPSDRRKLLGQEEVEG